MLKERRAMRVLQLRLVPQNVVLGSPCERDNINNETHYSTIMLFS